MNTDTPINDRLYPQVPKCLSDTAVRNAKPKSKPYKLSDGEGLFLQVMPSGSKYWRLKYFFADKEKLLALELCTPTLRFPMPERRAPGPKDTRFRLRPWRSEEGSQARNLIQSQENTFESVTREWHQNRKSKWTPKHAETTLRRLELRFPKAWQASDCGHHEPGIVVGHAWH